MIAPIAYIPLSEDEFKGLIERVSNRKSEERIVRSAEFAVRASTSGSHARMYTKVSNGRRYNLYSASSEVQTKCCMWCCTSFTGEVVGIPIEMTENATPTEIEMLPPKERESMRTVYMHRTCEVRMCGVYCSYSCALSGVRSSQLRDISSNADRKKAESTLRQLHKADYPGHTLYPAYSPNIMSKFGGWISEDEYNEFRNTQPLYTGTEDFTITHVSKSWTDSH